MLGGLDGIRCRHSPPQVPPQHPPEEHRADDVLRWCHQVAHVAEGCGYDRVVLASGDGIFADAVAGLVAHGVHVTVAAHETALSPLLAEVASEVLLLSTRTAAA